jgi:hypothetical protein
MTITHFHARDIPAWSLWVVAAACADGDRVRDTSGGLAFRTNPFEQQADVLEKAVFIDAAWGALTNVVQSLFAWEEAREAVEDPTTLTWKWKVQPQRVSLQGLTLEVVLAPFDEWYVYLRSDMPEKRWLLYCHGKDLVPLLLDVVSQARASGRLDV